MAHTNTDTHTHKQTIAQSPGHRAENSNLHTHTYLMHSRQSTGLRTAHIHTHKHKLVAQSSVHIAENGTYTHTNTQAQIIYYLEHDVWLKIIWSLNFIFFLTLEVCFHGQFLTYRLLFFAIFFCVVVLSTKLGSWPFIQGTL